MTKHCTALVMAALVTVLALIASTPVARADIFQWEYINAADPSQGKQQSMTLTPDGAGVSLGEGVNLANLNLTKAYLIGAVLPLNVVCDEADCSYYFPNLAGTTLAQADLTNAFLQGAILTNADFTGAEVRGASFVRYSSQSVAAGMTALQLYSTASYQAQNLEGVRISGYNFAGINLAGQNLAGAALEFTDLTDANLSQANLTNVRFVESTLTNANLSNAEVRGAIFSEITAAQLYSTASYQANDLTGINLDRNSLSGANFAGQNLTRGSFYGTALANANFQQANLYRASFTYPLGIFPQFGQVVADLTGANLKLANLTGVRLGGGEECSGEFCWYFEGANLNFADLSGADARAAYFLGASMIGTNTENMIQTNGHISGLNLTSDEVLIVRNYVGLAAPFPIVVDQSLVMDSSSTLQIEFDADAWGSTISFASGIPVALGGTLELAFAPGVNIATQNGRTIDVFDWNGVTPTGAFTVESPYNWDLSQLYTTGEITLAAMPELTGDYSGNGTVGPEDYTLWKSSFGSTTLLDADGNDDGIVNAADYTVWRDHLGSTLGFRSVAAFPSAAPRSAGVPEPSTLLMLLAAIVGSSLANARKCHKLTC